MKIKIGRLQSKEEFFKLIPLMQQAYKEVWKFAEIADPLEFGKWLKFKYETDNNFDLFISFDKETKEITGFGMGYLDYPFFLKEPYYLVDMVYVKPEYRRTNSAWLLMNALKKAASKKSKLQLAFLFADNSKKQGMPTIGKRYATTKKPFLIGMYRKE